MSIIQPLSKDSLSLDSLFHPESIAVIGVSPDLTRLNFGQEFLLSLINTGFRGKLYPVGLEDGEVFGCKIYRSLKEIPGTIDYVMVAIPARFTPQLVSECAEKGVKAIHFFTAGFSEVGDEKSKALERELIAAARASGIRVLGPNCMGIYYPKWGMAFHADFTGESGSLGIIAQSGGNAGWAIREGAQRGAFFSKVISYGNAADIDETELLEYLTADPETSVIAMYIEGVKNGRRFFEVLKRAALVKPVIVYKGGNTEIGTRAAASHTASIVGSGAVWSTVIKQAGAIQANSVEEIIDLALLFKNTAPPRGKNAAIIGLGGGSAVLVSDAWSNAGLEAHAFPAEIRRKLLDVFKTEAGSSFKNPLDLFSLMKEEVLQGVIEAVTGWEETNLVLLHLPLNFLNSINPEVLKMNTDALANLPEETKRKVIIVLHVAVSEEDRVTAARLEQTFYQAGFPTYPSAVRAANAVSKFLKYHEVNNPPASWGASGAQIH